MADEALDEALRVRTWRELQALESGCSPHAAAVFAICSARMHELEDLLAKGCPPDVAVDILSEFDL